MGTLLTKLLRPANGVILLGAASMFVGYTALPLPCPLIILLLPACLFWLARSSASGRLAFKRGWYTGLWGFSASLYWLSVPMTTVGGMPLILAIPCVLLLGSFLGLYTGLACFCFRGLLRFFAHNRGNKPTNPHIDTTSSPAPSIKQTFLQKLGISSESGSNFGSGSASGSGNNSGHPGSVSHTSASPASASHASASPASVSSIPPAHVQALEHASLPHSPLPHLSLHHLPLPASLFRRLLLVFLAGLCFGGIELISSFILTGFPWLSLPVALAGLPILVQPVNLMGAYGYSALLVIVALSPFMFRAAPVPSSQPRFWPVSWTSLQVFRRVSLCPPLGVAILLAGLGFYSYQSFHRSIPANSTPHNSIMVGIVQGNIDQNQKWHPVMQTATVEKHLALSLQAMKHSNAPLNLLVWPETAMPFFYQQGEPYRSQIHAFAQQHSVNIAFGTLGYVYAPPHRARHFNRLQLVSSTGRPGGHYDKEHLVPFGEYNPIPFTFDFLENILQGVNFSAGRNQPLLLLPDNAQTDSPRPGKAKAAVSAAAQNDRAPKKTAQNLITPEQRLAAKLGPDDSQQEPLARLGSLICYEVIFPGLAQERVSQGSDLLITISNDSWFGKTAAPQQHLNHAVLRAIEQGRSIVRSTTSGYSALILPNGEVKHKSSLYTEAAYSFAAPLANHTTVYHSLYHFIDLLLVLGLCITVVLGFKFRNL